MAMALFAWAALGLLLLFRRYLGWPTSFMLLQHQRGILYRRGKPAHEVAAGRHRVWTGVEKILFLDIRPISASFENRAVTLADGSTAVYGFSGSAEVDDVRKVLYSAGNYNEMPAFVLLCCARSVLNSQMSAGLTGRQAALVEQVIGQAKPRLAEAGFRLLNFRITQLGIASAAPTSNAKSTFLPETGADTKGTA